MKLLKNIACNTKIRVLLYKETLISDVQIVVPSVSQQDKVVVLKDLIDSEKAHVAELKGLVTNFLQPLEKSGM